jgi:16S rRNA (cytosine967-C5)-methyltransferase
MNSRKVTLEVLNQVLNNGAYSNIVLSNELNNSNLEDKDRALVTEIVYGTIKWRYTIDKILGCFLKNPLKNMDIAILNILRMSIYQMKYLNKIPDYAVVNEAVNLSKKVSIGASKLVNGVLRNYIRNKESNLDLKFKNKVEELSYLYSFEPWMIELFVRQYGEEATEAILQGLNSTPELTVRVNSLKADYDKVWDELIKAGYNLEEGFASPEAVKIIKGRNIENNPLFKEGYITVQDESAMMVAPLMELEETMTVLDLCSAPGGKTTHISELMNNKGKVLAFDIHENKLGLIKDNARRLGITNISCGVMDAAIYNDNLKASVNRVLIDVPCSGFGIISKKPEIKWTKSLKDLGQITTIQKKIIVNASKYVKKDGILIYSTCTLNRKENEDVVLWFLKNNNNYKIEEINVGNSNNFFYSKEGMLTILPNGKMDGFFITKLRRLE